MATLKWQLAFCLLASYLGVIAPQSCPSGWKPYGSSCYLFVLPTAVLRPMTWEDARANCLGYQADLVSILNSSEANFVNQQTRGLGNYKFWIGLYRNKTTSDPKEGWIWIDRNNFTNPQQWGWGEPNNYLNNENCAEVFSTGTRWNDNDCNKLYASICKRRQGLPDPTLPTGGTLPPTQEPPPTCDVGWVAYNRSCYRFFSIPRTWSDAKKACRDTGGHLVRIDNGSEQNFLTHSVRPTRHQYWIGLNDLEVVGRWVWEFRSKDPLVFKNWQSGEPNGPGREQCVEMYGYSMAGFWNDAGCNTPKSYICEKEEGQNMCPEGWIPFNDTCYQFNIETSQKMTWSEAEAACNAVGNFASLVQITSQREQDFITKQIQLRATTEVWIGLNDIQNENVFRWTAGKSDFLNSKYQIWANGNPTENRDDHDCVVILGVRIDGAWSVQNCSLKRNFVCMRHRDLPFCNGPLGMENGKIWDAQITASSSLSSANGPEQARLRHSSFWCPATASQQEYLQVELPYLADIRKIVTEGNVTSYTLRVSRDGQKFKDYKASGFIKHLIPDRTYGFVNTKSLITKFVRIYPNSWKSYPCMRVEFVGCKARALSTECDGNNWEKGPGNLCFQINTNYMKWRDARSVCLEQGGDLLTITTMEEKKAISDRIKKTIYALFWISLNDRDYNRFFYWSNNDANGLISWGSGAPDTSGTINTKACVAMKTSQDGGRWQDTDCSNRLPFICMKGEPYVRTQFSKTGPTGMWMSSAKYYWPLSAIDNNMILGTRLGKVNGKVTLTSGVKEKPNSALQFSGGGSYIDLGKFENECFTSPDYCSYGLSLSFMAWFDKTAAAWSKRVNIIDSARDETSSLGLSVYVQNQELWFVVSRTSMHMTATVPLVDSEWRHYVLRWNNSLGIRISIDGQDVSVNRGTSYDANKKNNPASSFIIGFQKGSSVTSGQVNLAMVAFWDKVLSNKDITTIYTAEFGKCPFNWMEYGMSCYQSNADTKTFYSARTQCQSSGGDLIDIDSNVEQAFTLTKLVKKWTWIGVHDRYKEGEFKRTNNEMLTYSNWNLNEPNDYWRNEDCAHLLTWGVWNDLSCYRSLAYICEKPKEVKPTNITTTVTPAPSTTTSKTLCHYTRATIGCPVGLAIVINWAFWGRRDKGRCTYVSIKECGVKEISTTTKYLKKKCDHLQSCNLHASETESYLTNPCPSVHKYLELNYTCVKDTFNKGCKKGWSSYKENCYRLFDTPKTWNDARTTCKNAGAELLSISSNYEQQFSTFLMERAWYSDVWMGLNDLTTKGVYQWSDGSPVSVTYWYAGQPDERRTDKSCVFMSLWRSKRGWMYWMDQNCTRQYPFVCKHSVGTTQKPATAPTGFPGKCDAASGWVTNDKLGNCYYYKPNMQNWLNAKSYCLGLRANLVSIQSKEENEFVRKLSNNTLWLGLDAKGVFRGHVWSNGKPVRYTDWDVGQPDSYNGLQACVQMDPDTGRWSDENCDSRRDFVCMKPKAKIPVTKPPVVYPSPGSPLCKKGWTLFKGMCYIAGNDTSYDYRNWHEAEQKCRSFNGHLVSVNSLEEHNFLQFLIKGHSARDFWIGLNDLGSEGIYKWTDNSVYNFGYWNTREPNDYNRQEDCVHLIRTIGKWNDHHCQKKFSYICKAHDETYKPPSTTTPPPRPQDDGYCPKGWKAHAGYCYEFHTDPWDYRTWDDARDACERGRNSSDLGELVSIHDEFELAFITVNIKGATQWLWTGMNNKHGYSSYFWVDNTFANYFKWNTREPRSGYGRCVEIVPYRWAAGRWNSAYCWKRNGYICKKAASNSPITPPTTSPPTESKCPKGYKSFDESCYKFVKSPQTFDDARKVCQKDDGDLMAVHDQFKQAYLIYLLERYIGNVWIGLLHEPYNVFMFLDHSSPLHSYWGSGQPNRQLGQRSCTQANITGANFGVWDDVDCSTTNPFVCEIYKGEPKVTIPINATCPAGWRHYDKYCYKHFGGYGRTWSAAQYECSRQGAHLVSVHNDREQDFLIFFFQNIHPISIWTGLNDREVERGYQWVDRGPVDYVNWGNGEPNDHGGNENCVEMQTRSGRWNDLACSRYRQFMCKKKLECSSVIPLDSSMVTVTDTYNASTFGADKAILTDGKTDSAWCTKNTSGNAKIMIRLNELVRVTGISVMGRTSVNQFVKSFRIDYERDELWRRYYPNDNFQDTMQGNRNPGEIITKTFTRPIALDGLAITPVTWAGDMICMKIRLHGCAYVCQKRLFSAFPARIRGSDTITASSSKYPTNGPKQAGIAGNAWCAEKNDDKQWIQFNFVRENLVSAVRTFGNKKESYVKTYSVQFSDDGKNWVDYEQHGTKRIFQGNNDPVNPMRHTILNEIEALFVRIIPLSWNKNICMRVALLGCAAACDKPLLATDKSTKFQYSSSDENSNPEYALFNTGKAWCTSQTPLSSQYLEINLGKRYLLSKIATQPSPLSYNEGGAISTFTMEYKIAKRWFVYDIKGTPKVLIGVNQQSNSEPMVNVLTDHVRPVNSLRAKAIRIYPRNFNGTKICMRVELYGCIAAGEIIPTTQTTAQKVVGVSLRFTSIEWDDKLKDKKSEEFITTSAKIIKAVESVYSKSESFRSVEVVKLSKGSVVAKIKIVFNPEFVDNVDNVTSVLEAAVKSGKVGSLAVDKEYFKRADEKTQASTGDDSSGLSGGAVAGVVITVLILVAVAAGLAFLFYRRKQRKDLFSPKHFDNPISYSSKAYDMDD